MPKPKILAFAGSSRADSFNRKLVRIAAEGAQNAGAEVTLLELGELELPLFDQDLEAEHGLPAGALRLKELMNGHDGLLIASPEYNSSITPLLKNAIDWASRPATAEEPRLLAFNGKTAALMSASPGALGGLRGLVHLRAILANINVLVLPDQKAIPQAHNAFTDDGRLSDDGHQQAIKAIGEKLAKLLQKLNS